jgi:hypothetical protein
MLQRLLGEMQRRPGRAACIWMTVFVVVMYYFTVLRPRTISGGNRRWDTLPAVNTVGGEVASVACVPAFRRLPYRSHNLAELTNTQVSGCV